MKGKSVATCYRNVYSQSWSWYVIWLIMWGCCDMFVGWLALDTVDRMQIRSHFTLILHLATRHCCYWLLLYHITHPSPNQQTVNNTGRTQDCDSP